MNEDELIEKMAALEHEQWAHAVSPFLDFAFTDSDSLRWRRQRETSYSNLTENEKESDRKWANKAISRCRDYFAARLKEVEKENEELRASVLGECGLKSKAERERDALRQELKRFSDIKIAYELQVPDLQLAAERAERERDEARAECAAHLETIAGMEGRIEVLEAEIADLNAELKVKSHLLITTQQTRDNFYDELSNLKATPPPADLEKRLRDIFDGREWDWFFVTEKFRELIAACAEYVGRKPEGEEW